MRKLCGTFAVLPSSFTLTPTFDEREATPFDSGGSSYVYKATFEGRPVAIKTLRVSGTADPRKVHKVSNLHMYATRQPLIPDPKLLAREVVGWKWLRHDNILPFVGVVFTPPLVSIVSEQMKNGNIMDFVRSYPKINRMRLVSEWNTAVLLLY